MKAKARVLRLYIELWLRLRLDSFYDWLRHEVLGKRRNDQDGLDEFVRLNRNAPLRGIFIDDTFDPYNVNWIKYPRNVEWIVVRSFKEFKAALAWNKVHIVSVGMLCSGQGSNVCLDFLRGIKALGLQNPLAVFIHEKDPLFKKALTCLWTGARIN